MPDVPSIDLMFEPTTPTVVALTGTPPGRADAGDRSKTVPTWASSGRRPSSSAIGASAPTLLGAGTHLPDEKAPACRHGHGQSQLIDFGIGTTGAVAVKSDDPSAWSARTSDRSGTVGILRTPARPLELARLVLLGSECSSVAPSVPDLVGPRSKSSAPKSDSHSEA